MQSDPYFQGSHQYFMRISKTLTGSDYTALTQLTVDSRTYVDVGLSKNNEKLRRSSMDKILGSDHLGSLSVKLDSALRHLNARNLDPISRKSDRDLRRFTIREMADLCFRMNYNTLRHYLKTIDGIPEGQTESGNRKTYSLNEVHSIQETLFKLGKILPDQWPGRLDGEGVTKLITFNLKGGVSKTSTVANLSQLLAARGFKILLVDLDPQASCSDLFDVKADLDDLPSIYDVVKYEDPMAITDVVQATYFPNIDIIPGSIGLTEFEYESAAASRNGIPFYSRISDPLQTIEDSYDIILFDTPPHMSFSVIAAIYAANSMIVPLSAGMLDVVSLVKFLDLAAHTLDAIEGEDKDISKRYDFIKILLTRYSPGDSAQLQLGSFLRSTLGDTMMTSDFLSSTAIADAGNTMEPLLEVEPSSFTRKTYDRIFDSLHAIAMEVEGEIMKSRGRTASGREAE